MFDLVKSNITRLKETQIFQSLTMALNNIIFIRGSRFPSFILFFEIFNDVMIISTIFHSRLPSK